MMNSNLRARFLRDQYNEKHEMTAFLLDDNEKGFCLLPEPYFLRAKFPNIIRQWANVFGFITLIFSFWNLYTA